MRDSVLLLYLLTYPTQHMDLDMDMDLLTYPTQHMDLDLDMDMDMDA